MSVAVLEVNDCAVRLAIDGELCGASPAYARLGRDGVVAVGEEARRVARLEPHNVTNRFWHELDDKPLGLMAAGGRSNADLAFEHLRAVCDPVRDRLQSMVALVPGDMRPQQLQLLLGIAREAGVPLAGFLDTAIAAAAAWSGRGRMIRVDVHQHRAVLTAVELDARLRRDRVESVPRAGWTALTDRWMKAVAALFVARTRFDPLHDARSEQNLFDTLPVWLAQLQSDNRLDAQMSVGGEEHQVTLSRELIELEARPLYDQIVLAAHRLRRAGHPTTVGLSSAAASLPGLVTRFTEFHDCDLIVFPPGAELLAAQELDLPWSVEEHNAALQRSAPSLTAGPPAAAAPAVVQHAQSGPAAAPPTHVLYRGRAHAVDGEPLVIGAGGPRLGIQLSIPEASAGISRVHCSLLRMAEGAVVIDHSRYGTWLNDERVVGRAPLRAGDRLRLGNPGVSLELIAID